MPVELGHDHLSRFYRWGRSGAKYRFESYIGALVAYQSALEQGRAIKAHQRSR